MHMNKIFIHNEFIISQDVINCTINISLLLEPPLYFTLDFKHEKKSSIGLSCGEYGAKILEYYSSENDSLTTAVL